MNQVFVCATFFQVYVSILKIIHTKEKNAKVLLIVNDHTPGIEKIFPALQSSGFFDYFLHVPFRKISLQIKKETKAFSRIIKRNKHAVEFVDSNSEIFKYDDFIRNSEINIFSNFGLTPVYFLLKYKKNFIRQLEDGEGNYISRVGYFKAFKRKYILNTVIGDGLDKEIKEIEVQFPEKLSRRLRKKGKKLELKKMLEELSMEDKKKILNIFAAELELKFSNKKKLLLITQPLSEDKYMTENQKVDLYNEIFKRYADQYSLFMKPHPRELTDYRGKMSCDFTVIARDFPLEMFDLIQGIRFELGITVSSSSLANINCVDKKIVLGREYFMKPLPSNWYEEHEKMLQLSHNS